MSEHEPAANPTPGSSETAPEALPGALTAPEDVVLHLRKLSHDLSNALEIVVQTSYLLSLQELKEPADQWLRMLDEGVNKSLQLNSDLRAYIRTLQPR